MFLILSTYLKPVEEVDKYLARHREFLSKCYEKQIFVCSGARQPRTGGVILARGLSRGQLEALMAEDPFVQNGISAYEFIEFNPTMKLDGFEPFCD